jgi:hypothetical protein
MSARSPAGPSAGTVRHAPMTCRGVHRRRLPERLFDRRGREVKDTSVGGSQPARVLNALLKLQFYVE